MIRDLEIRSYKTVTRLKDKESFPRERAKVHLVPTEESKIASFEGRAERASQAISRQRLLNSRKA